MKLPATSYLLSALLLLTVPVHTQDPVPVPPAPIIGQATMWNTWPMGRVALGVTAVGMTVEQAEAITWELELDGQPWMEARADHCDARWGGAGNVLCEVPHPVLQDVQFVRVRVKDPAVVTVWSEPWQISMVPCGHFVGQEIFRNTEAVLKWKLQPAFGGECTEPEATGTPLQPEGLHIVRP